MKTTGNIGIFCVIYVQMLLVTLPPVKSFFRDIGLFSAIGCSDLRERQRILSSNKTISSNDGIEVSEKALKKQKCCRLSHDVDEGGDLVFEGKFNYQSDIVSIPTAEMSSPVSNLFEFFSDPKNRDLAIKGGGNQCERIPLTPELHNEWTIQSKIVDSTPPDAKGNGDNRNEEILAVYSEVPIVPGLSLRAISYTGCKTMKEPTSSLPYYEFTLLNESYKPVGKKTMTWIFNKITGNDRNNRENKNYERNEYRHKSDILSRETNQLRVLADDDDGSSSVRNINSRKTYALSRVMLERLPQDGGYKICYYGHVKLILSKKFLHILPLPTRVIQAKVNKSIRKQLELECTTSIQKLIGALNRWNDKSNSSGAKN